MKTHRSTLVLLRHGQSEWNSQNRFTGWVDIGLTPAGVTQASAVGAQLRNAGFTFDLAVTSALWRATATLGHLLQTLGQPYLPAVRSWRLNDRHYGALTGMDKNGAAQVYGVEQVRQWRRGFDLAPPAMQPEAQRALLAGIRETMPPADTLPSSESLSDTLQRVLPLWTECVAPALQAGQTVLMVGHGNSLRALLKHLNTIDDHAIAGLEVDHAQPCVLRFDAQLRLCAQAQLDSDEDTGEDEGG